MFLPEQGIQVKKIPQAPVQPQPGGRIRLQLAHININCHEKDTGYTPLITAVLQGKLRMINLITFK